MWYRGLVKYEHIYCITYVRCMTICLALDEGWLAFGYNCQYINDTLPRINHDMLLMDVKGLVGIPYISDINDILANCCIIQRVPYHKPISLYKVAGIIIDVA